MKTKRVEAPWCAVLALGEEHGVELPSQAVLDEFRVKLKLLRGTKEWKRHADMTRQIVERYLQDMEMSLELAPVVAGILVREGEPWPEVQARMIANIILRKNGAR